MPIFSMFDLKLITRIIALNDKHKICKEIIGHTLQNNHKDLILKNSQIFIFDSEQ